MQIGEGFVPADSWLQISKHLRPLDLQACMQLCKHALPLWVSDRIWKAQWLRIARVCPEVEVVLAMYPSEQEDADGHTTHSLAERITKKRRVKKSFLMPRGGYWFAMQRLAKMGVSMRSLQKHVGRNPELLPIMQAVVRICSGNGNHITKTEIKSASDILPDTYGRNLRHVIQFDTKENDHIRCLVFKGDERLLWEAVNAFGVIPLIVWRAVYVQYRTGCNQWTDFLLDENQGCWWWRQTDQVERLNTFFLGKNKPFWQ